jgi:hypothetical protein
VVGLTVAVALTAAIAFGWSTALMHHSASGAPDDVRGLVALLRHLIRQWRWLLGMAASLLGLALHALALSLGSLAVVQPLIVTGLVFSFLFRAALDRQLPSHRMMSWVLLTAAGLTIFLLASTSSSGSATPSGAGSALMLGAGAVALGTGWLTVMRLPGHAGLLLGGMAGVVFGLIAGVLKATTSAARGGLLPLFSSWSVYVLALLGLTGFLLNQRAYRQAPLSRSLPAANTVNPVVAVVFGLVAYRERPPDGVGTIAAEVIGLAAVLTGVFFLARSEGERVVADVVDRADQPVRPDAARALPSQAEEKAWE